MRMVTLMKTNCTTDSTERARPRFLWAGLIVLAMVMSVAPLGHGAGPATSPSWTMVDHQVVSGGGTQSAASYSVDACLSYSISGRQASPSYQVDAGCVTTVGQTVPVELMSFVIE